MDKEKLLQEVLASDELPTLPTVASQIINMTAREDTTLADIGDLVSKDLALSAKILKVSNSAFYSFPQQIGSITQAVSILGINAVRSLVLSFSFLTMRAGSRPSEFDFERFWEKSLTSAVASKLILDQVKGADTEEIFVCGLLQNLGQLIFARTFPERYDEVMAQSKQEGQDLVSAELAAFGLDHTAVGTEVARSWGFPEVLIQPIFYHHQPQEYTGNNTKIRQTVRAVYLSDLLNAILFSDKPEDYHKQFRREAASLLKLSSQDIEAILDQVHHKVNEAGRYFNLKVQCPKSVQEILQEANIRLSLLNLDYDQMNKQLIQAKIHLEKMTKELEEKNRILDNLANLDGLTGIYNHRFFQHSLDQEISRATRHESQLSLLLIDIDFFKKINDTYGHQVGDLILQDFARLLKANIRQYDTVARYGGEEFVIILPETSSEDAVAVAEKLRLLVEEHEFNDKGETYRITASFGQASAKPAIIDDFSKSDFIAMADKALYEAKRQGRNQVIAYSPKKKWFSFS